MINHGGNNESHQAYNNLLYLWFACDCGGFVRVADYPVYRLYRAESCGGCTMKTIIGILLIVLLIAIFASKTHAQQSCVNIGGTDNCPGDMICYQKNPIISGVCVQVYFVRLVKP